MRESVSRSAFLACGAWSFVVDQAAAQGDCVTVFTIGGGPIIGRQSR
jgi:hypothetical protein